MGDELGLTPYGEPRYKWVQAGDLTFPVKAKDKWVVRNGLHVPEAQFEMRPQCPHLDRRQWVLAMWLVPPSLFQWKMQFGTEAGYQERGYFMATDCIRAVGKKPTENVTRGAIGAIKQVREMNLADFEAHHEAKAAKNEKDTASLYDDWLKDKMTAFGEVPGSRGGLTSFPEARPGLKEAVVKQ